MYTRFITLTNELKSLGRIILEEDKVKKILTMVLPITWESKITAIQESKKIVTFKLDELTRNLTAYEHRRQTMKMDAPKKERSLSLRIAEGIDLEKDEMAMIIRDLKKYLMKGKDFIDESEVINNEKEQLSKECVILKAKCKNLELRASESDSKNAELKNQVLKLDTIVLELRTENLKLKLGTGKKKADHIHLTLKENLGKMKDELYKKDEQISVLKEDLSKVKHELDRACKWNKSSDALSWLQEYHSSNKRGLVYRTPAPK
ncbi:WEB family protein At5g16730, chloroplastic-like [Nicotiana sylvestris]|uniref:WEB family protein At5g16730, chloroplastic-like n=1 Tax=Nicotiana sylvestris TaxID=4096 RepID=UPI00388C36B8